MADNEDKPTQAIESRIKSAIEARTSHFQSQAESITLGDVKRLLEKDLGLETYALDSHKRLIKLWLQPIIDSALNEKSPKSQTDNEEMAVSSAEGEEPVAAPQMKIDLENNNSGGGEAMEDSPVMGLLTGSKKVKANTDEVEDTKKNVFPSEAIIKKVIWARASYLRENSHITMIDLRRLLEEDLALDKQTLDPCKKFIRKQVDEILNSNESPSKAVSARKKTAQRASKEETPTTSGDENENSQEVKVRKRPAPKAKLQKSEAVRKRQKTEADTKVGKTKQSKVSKPVSDESGEEDGGGASEDDNSESSAEKPVKKKEVPKASYGKQVEHLKSVIKSCGMSVPPVVYKKVKQAPENKREACLIKELEELLSKEGLSTNPSEKEIKDVKKKKERARELEGIDMSNIVSSSRRRSAISFAPPPKPKIPDLSESESEESEDGDDDEDDDDDDEEGGDDEVEDEEPADEDPENDGDGSPSEASDKDNGDSD